MNVWDVVATLGSICVLLQWIPELWQAWKTKHLKDLNWLLTFFGITGATLFFFYGLHLGDFFITFLNAFVGVCIIVLAAMKWTFERKRK